MSQKKFPRERLSLFGPLNVKDINDYLCTSKKTFRISYDAPFTQVIKSEYFEILYTLAKGGFGQILLVRDPDKFLYAMKVLLKRDLVSRGNFNETLNEKKILQSIDFPFGMRLEFFFQDKSYLYLGLPFMPGGDMFTHLTKLRMFEEKLARFYAAQVLLGLEYLHNLLLVHRDIKPENLLIDQYGYLKITDFGFTKVVTNRTFSLCGTPAYFAPEMILGQGYGRSVDWWAFGVLIFEMIAGRNPFSCPGFMRKMENILLSRYRAPTNVSREAKDLIDSLLTVNVTMRLGNLKNGAQDVKKHPWFRGVNWLAVFNRRLEAPFVPDTSTLENFPSISSAPDLAVTENDEFMQFKDF